MKRSERDSINRVAANVVRQANEPEDIDLAAEATEGAPAKTLQPAKTGAPRSAPRPGPGKKSPPN